MHSGLGANLIGSTITEGDCVSPIGVATSCNLKQPNKAPEWRNAAEWKERKSAEWSPPRGIRFFHEPRSLNRPWVVEWRVDGKKPSRGFATKEARTAFAKSLTADLKANGLAALRLDPDEARAWRAFREDIGEAPLAEVSACWRRFGSAKGTIDLGKAVEAFLLAKTREGVSPASLGHFRPLLERFSGTLGPIAAGSVQRDSLEGYLSGLDCANETRRTTFKRIRTLFRWLRDTRQIPVNPCDGWKGPKSKARAVSVLTVEDGQKLFKEIPDGIHGREILGRMALEAFAGMRHETAAQLPKGAIDFKSRVITVPASIDKNRKDQFIEHAPENLWRWLEWSKPETWSMGRFNYRNAKSLVFVVAKVWHPHNALRHSAASYHIALTGDAGKTAAMLTHSNLRMLWSNYRGKGGGKENGEAWFAINPPS